MRSLDEALNELAYHPATPDTARRHDEARTVVMEAVRKLWPLIPDGPVKTLALRHLQQALHFANTAIALTAPVDEIHPDVARVLPGSSDAQNNESSSTKPVGEPG